MGEQELVEMLPKEKRPRILERQGFLKRVKTAIENIIDIFEW